MAEERELILKLGKKITDRIPYKLGMEKLTVNDPEYWGLAGVVTDEMAEVALCMEVRKPITLPKLAKKTKKPEAELEKLLQEMAVVGIIEYNWENPQHEKQYILPMYVPGSAEFMVMNKEQVEEHTEIADFFENMSRLPLEKVTPMVPLGGARYRYACYPGREGYSGSTGICRCGAYFPLAEKIQGQVCDRAVFLPSAAESPRRGNRRYRGRVVHRCRRYGRLPGTDRKRTLCGA